MAQDNALPWFPLSPNFISEYFGDVMKYLLDICRLSDSELNDDKSYNTTVSLLYQRGEQIRIQYLEQPLLDSYSLPGKDIELDARIVAAALVLKCRYHEESALQYLTLLCYLLSLLSPKLSSSLSSVVIRCIKAAELCEAGITIDDVREFNIPNIVKKVEGATMVVSDEVRWYQNHGTIKVTSEDIRLYPMNRLFVTMKESRSGSALHPVSAIEDGNLKAMQDKKAGKQLVFELDRFVGDCIDVKDETEKPVLRKYSDGDALSVRIVRATYDSIVAESIDPAYEKLAGSIRITGGSNVRGLYLTDFARNLCIGTIINVNYKSNPECFRIDDTVVDFIYENYWSRTDNGLQYDSTTGVLLFRKSGDVLNTWLTKEGFLVRSKDDESYPRYTQKVLDVVEYDKQYDFIIVEVAGDPDGSDRIDERRARDSFIQHLIYRNKTILAPEEKKPEIKAVSADHFTFLQRMEAIRADNAIDGTDGRFSVLSFSIMLSCILGDEKDYDYYCVRKDYIVDLVNFAQMKLKQIGRLDKRGLSGERILTMSTICDILAQYGESGGSDEVSAAIAKLPDTQISAVAKLVRAANDFIGTPSLDCLRTELHREICVILGVSDKIEGIDSEDDGFPFRPEGEDIEHKMSWVFDNATGQFNETAQSSKCLKTICAFMNRYGEQGESHLYIGTDEKRRFVCGIQPDIDELVAKGLLKASGDAVDEYLRVSIMKKIQERFPDTYQNVTPSVCMGGKVIDLCVQPAIEGVVYYNNVAYYRSGSESKVMALVIEEEIRNRKFLLRSGLADKIDSVRRAINLKHTVCLAGYDSSSSNSARERKVEAFAFTDNRRCDAIWAFDHKDRKNKVFLLKRADGVKVLDEFWKNEKYHRTSELDIFGFSGSETIPICFDLLSTRAKNQFVESYPGVSGCLEKKGNTRWRIKATLYNSLSLEAACSFYLGLSDEIDISGSPVLQKRITERVERVLSKL